MLSVIYRQSFSGNHCTANDGQTHINEEKMCIKATENREAKNPETN